MAYVPVPKDLTKVKTKVALNLTKRQLLCFSVVLLLGLPLFFLLKDSTGTSAAAFVMILVCCLVAMYEKHGQPLETVLKHIIQTKFVRQKERHYQTDNFYSLLQMQADLGYRNYNNEHDLIVCPECANEHDIVSKCPGCGLTYEGLQKKAQESLEQIQEMQTAEISETGVAE